MCHPVLPPRCAVIAQAALAHQIGQHGSVEVFPSIEVTLVLPLRAVTALCGLLLAPAAGLQGAAARFQERTSAFHVRNRGSHMDFVGSEKQNCQ